jgi:hypothetical protein
LLVIVMPSSHNGSARGSNPRPFWHPGSIPGEGVAHIA